MAAPPAGEMRLRTELFGDATADWGLDFVHANGMSGELYFAEMNGAGACLLDFDRDGDLDLFLVQGGRLEGRENRGEISLTDRLYRNERNAGAEGSIGSAALSDVTAAAGLAAFGYGMGAACADYDNDGWTDVYVVNLGGNQLLRNRGDGTFENVTEHAGVGDGAWSVSATFADFDRDGWLDLYVVNYVDFDLTNHRICPAPSGIPDYCGPQAFRAQSDRLYRNLGDGTFRDVSESAGLRSVRAAGMGVASGDFDGDGRLDFYVANDQVENHLWLNLGDGSFENGALLSATGVNELGAPEASMGIAAGDFDNDGDEDLFLTHLRRETNTLYRNDGAGLFTDVSRASGLGAPSWAYTSFGTGWLDFDNDGWLDLMTVSGSVRRLEDQVGAGDPHPLRQPNQLFRNLTNGRFAEVGAEAGKAVGLSEVSRGAAFGDLDNDGDTDVVVTNNGGPARIFLNRVGQDRHWLGLRLVLREHDRDALGAWACVMRPPAKSLCRRARAGGSYASSSDPRVLFGLGDAIAVEAVEVTWPSGRQEWFTIEGVDRYLTLQEGSGTARP